jgi:hypothetical protein
MRIYSEIDPYGEENWCNDINYTEIHEKCKEKIEYYLQHNQYCQNLYSNIKEEDKNDIISCCFFECFDYFKRHPEMEEKKNGVISYFVRYVLSPQIRRKEDKKIIIPL